ATNHSLDDLANTNPNAATVYSDLQLTGSGSIFTGSDHYPVVADYVVMPVPVVLTSQGFTPGGSFRLQLTAAPSTSYTIEASNDLSTWKSIGSGQTDASGLLLFQDSAAAAYRSRFYRATGPAQ